MASKGRDKHIDILYKIFRTRYNPAPMSKLKPATVRELREARNWTQEDLEARSGVKQGQISQIETGKTADPKFSTVIALARAFGVPPETIRFGVSIAEAAR